MNSISEVLNQVLVLFIIIFVGYIAKKKEFIDYRVEQSFSKIIVYITLPLLIFVSFCHNPIEDILENGISLLIFSFIIFIIFIFFSKFAFTKFDKEKQPILKFSSVYSNCGFMGFPILYSIYGKIGILYAAIFNIPFDILIWTVGIREFEKKTNQKNLIQIIKDPNIISVIIGLFIMIFNIKVPKLIIDSTEMLGNMTTPLAMLLIGAMLFDIDIKKAFDDISIIFILLLRLLVIPLLSYVFLIFLRVNSTVIEVIVICQAMPVAALGAIIAKQHNRNPKYASVVVFSSTLFSIVTIPAIVYLLLR